MRKPQRLFRTTLFGGYNKKDVRRYVRRLEEELEERERENEERINENEKNQKLIEEAISEIQRIRIENEQLRKEKETETESPLRREIRERRERYQRRQ